MGASFPAVIAALRRERGISQRKAAAELHISQALLSHYENGAREPGLDFLCRACEYYGVTADCLLGREALPSEKERRYAAAREVLKELRALTDRAEELLGEREGQAGQSAGRKAPERIWHGKE